jgi:hypothetical protein
VADEGATTGVPEPLTLGKIVGNASRMQVVQRTLAGPELLLIQAECSIQYLRVRRLRIDVLPGPTGLHPFCPCHPVARRRHPSICQTLAGLDEGALFVLHDKTEHVAVRTTFTEAVVVLTRTVASVYPEARGVFLVEWAQAPVRCVPLAAQLDPV